MNVHRARAGSVGPIMEVHRATSQVDGADNVLQGRHKGLPVRLADNVDIVAAGVNDVRHDAQRLAVGGVHGQTFDFKPVVFTGGQAEKTTDAE